MHGFASSRPKGPQTKDEKKEDTCSVLVGANVPPYEIQLVPVPPGTGLLVLHGQAETPFEDGQRLGLRSSLHIPSACMSDTCAGPHLYSIRERVMAHRTTEVVKVVSCMVVFVFEKRRSIDTQNTHTRSDTGHSTSREPSRP